MNNPKRNSLHAAALFAAASFFHAGTVSAGAAAPQWQAIPLVTSAAKQAGHTGGEGGQVVQTLVVSAADPTFALMGTDVGGIYRSLDAGKTWQVCMVGWHARGGNFFAVDPKNASRVVGLGGNGINWNRGWGPSPNGVYLSTNKGASWKQVSPSLEGDDWRTNSLAFDPASFDARLGYCKVVYWLTASDGLWKSADGGAAWSKISPEHSNGQLKVHPAKGYVYVAGSRDKTRGLYRSKDGGVTFQKMNDERALTLDVIAAKPDTVYLAGPKKVLVSDDCGETFRPAGAAKGLPVGAEPCVLSVDPADPLNMVCNHGGPQWWESYSYASLDGGETWTKEINDPKNHFLPLNHDSSRFAYFPTQPHTLLNAVGSGAIVRSADGGRTFVLSSDGENAIMQGASFGFSPTAPASVFLSFQDFNAAASPDGGRTWAYLNPAGNEWGGFEYGGFTVDGRVMWTGDAAGWVNPRTLKVSRNGGATWAVMKDSSGKNITWGGSEISFSDPCNPNVLFASDYRSADKGLTWTKMTGCEGVFTASPTGGKALYGRHGNKVCRSADSGATWTDVTPFLSGSIKDIAYDQVRDRIYAASEDRVKYFEKGQWYALSLPKDFKGGTHAISVAVDPSDPSLVYTCGPSNTLATDATVSASTDAGKMWVNLTVTTPLTDGHQGGGPHEVTWVRVHPTTHALWAASGCYGMWKIAASSVKAYAAFALKTAGDPTLVPKLAPVAITVQNGSMTDGTDKPIGWDGAWGAISSARDTAVFKTAPAAFRVSTGGKKGQGSDYQTLNAPAGTKFTISGSVKSRGATAQCAMQSFNSSYNSIGFQQIKWVPAGTDWTDFTGTVTLPDGTAHFEVVLLIDGTGEGWLDDIKIADVQGP